MDEKEQGEKEQLKQIIERLWKQGNEFLALLETERKRRETS